MSAVYYEVTGAEELAFCRDFRARRTAVRERFMDFATAKGAQGFVSAYGFINGLIFKNDTAPAGWTAQKRRTSDGRAFFQPAKRGDVGKALKVEMDALEREPLPSEFGERFGVPAGLRYEKTDTNYGAEALTACFPWSTFIAWIDGGDSFWVLLPDVAERIAARTAEGYTCEPASFTPPPGLKRSSRARYDLAIAAAAVAEEEAEAAA